ncbi:ketoacyl-ACP synthase III [Ferrimonas senticii]|uniref:ketoacyl-ACP synthase III n=1 Tax=Ferrimonas senticii TaxID=394566 RepID=UPI000400C9C0|nr:ketoacyl-ACP synthase III [Ferrimonas senticii]
MINAEISGWGKCLPPAVLTNDDLATIMDTNDEWIRSRTGIGQRYISHVPNSQMATVAGQRALACAGIDASELDMILIATCSPDTLLPNMATEVQAALGAECAAMDLNAACSGFLYGLGLATAQIRSGQMRNILIIGTERLSFFLNWTLRESAVLFGDGAGAVVLSATESEQPAGVLSYAMHNDPSGSEHIKVANFGSNMDRFQTDSFNFHLQFNGREVFKRAIAGMGKMSIKVLEQAQLSSEQIDIVIPHQANERIIDTLIGKMGIPKEKAFINIEGYGNTSAATIPIAITDALQQGRIKPGDTILSCAFGSGLTSAAATIKWGQRITPLGESDAELPVCKQSALELIASAVAYQKQHPIG